MGQWSGRTKLRLGLSTPAIEFSIPGFDFSVAGFERVPSSMARLWRSWLKRAEGLKNQTLQPFSLVRPTWASSNG